MATVVLRSVPRSSSSGNSFRVEVIGDGPTKDAVKETIGGLEHNPAKASRRALMNLLYVIERHNLDIRHTEHYFDEDGLEVWLFVLQG